MRLATKISAAAASLLLILSQGFALWNLTQTQKRLIETIAQAEGQQLQRDMYSFAREYQRMDKYFQDERGERFWAVTAFRGTYSENTVLYYRGEEICNSTPYQFDVKNAAGESLALNMPHGLNHVVLYKEKADGRDMLILKAEDENVFQMVRYRDVTEIYQKSRALFIRGIAVSAALSLLLLAALFILLKRILKPFYSLQDAADKIAGGDYGRRIEVESADEVGEMAKSFNGMAQRVQEHIRELADINEKQNRLLGALSHEMKTPLTGIQGYAELLQKVELPPEKKADALEYIGQECRRLNRLSAKMLQFVELSGEEQTEKRSLDVGALFRKAEEITAHRLREKDLRLEIECEEGLAIEGDEDLLLSLLTNLIDNAAKASSPGGAVYLIGEKNRLAVRDEGCGIPDEEIGRVTEPFYMVDKSRARRQGGAGLGLALCRQIARLHGGELIIASEMGKGSTAELCLTEETGLSAR